MKPAESDLLIELKPEFLITFWRGNKRKSNPPGVARIIAMTNVRTHPNDESRTPNAERSYPKPTQSLILALFFLAFPQHFGVKR